MNIFIAGLSYNLSEAELEELFAEYGEVVSAKVIMDRETGRSKGYGFVEMAEDEAGNKAIEALNGAEVDGKTLSVSVARPKQKDRVEAITTTVAVDTMAETVAVDMATETTTTAVVIETTITVAEETDINL